MSWQPEIDDLRRREEMARRMGGPDKIKRQHDGGKLTVRERIERLLDAGSFHEIGAIAGKAQYDEAGNLIDFMASNFVMGRGRIDGRTVSVGGDDFTVRGGAADASIWEKQMLSEQMAGELGIPVFTLNGTDFADLLGDIRTVGRVTGVPQRAAALTAQMAARAAAIQAAVAKEARVSCFFEAYYPPLTSVGPHTFIFLTPFTPPGMERIMSC